VAVFLGAAAFLGAAFLAAGLAGPLVTRPDLVLPRTVSFGATAGAEAGVFLVVVAFFWCSSLLGGGSLLGCSSLGGSLLGRRLLGGRGGRWLLWCRLGGGSTLLGDLDWTRWALGLREIARLDTGFQAAVEHRVKDLGRGGAELVVGLDVFLDGLAAASIAILELDDGILDHVLVARVSGRSSSLLGRSTGSFLGRHLDGCWC